MNRENRIFLVLDHQLHFFRPIPTGITEKTEKIRNIQMIDGDKKNIAFQPLSATRVFTNVSEQHMLTKLRSKICVHLRNRDLFIFEGRYQNDISDSAHKRRLSFAP